MQAEFRAPRRRTRVQEEYEAPLPVSRIPEDWTPFRAQLLNQHVLVCHPDHIQKIHNQGYFGKGILSRARPDHSVSDQWEEHEGLFLPAISQCRYEELLRWAGSALFAQGLDKEAVNQTLLRLSQPIGMEDVRREMGGEKPGAEGGVSPHTERLRPGSEVEGGVSPHTERLRPGSEVEGGVSPHTERLRPGSEVEGGVSPHTERLRPGSEVEGGVSPHTKRLRPGSEVEGGVSPHTKRLRPGSEVEGGVSPHTKRLRPGLDQDSDTNPDPSSDQDSDTNPDPSSDQDSDTNPDPSSDQDCDPGPDPDPLVPGPGFVLVVSDSKVCGRIREVRRTPVSLNEYLQLSLEEAFFLVYSLGCLSVYLHQEPLSIIQLWRKFRSLRPDFVSSFAAYQHFRSRGWVPKGGGGAKYGVDLMLYRKGPPFYHASYSVVIERANDAFRGSGLRQFSWRSLAALSRITSNVSKELMLCYIIYPVDLSETELDSPVCLSRLKVQEVIVSRWVSSRERAEQDDI